MQETNYELRVGFFALVAFIILVVSWSWLKSFSLFNQPQLFTVTFHDVSGLSRNATVNVQGVRVGTVDDMQFAPPDELIKVRIKISDQSIRVPQGATITIQTLGMVGAKYIEITLPENRNAPPLDENSVVEGVDPVRFELVLNGISSKLNKVFANIDSEKAGKTIDNMCAASAKLNKNMDRFAATADSVTAASKNIAETSRKIGNTAQSATGATQQAEAFFADGDKAVKKVNKILDNPSMVPDIKETVDKANKTIDKLQDLVTNVTATLKDPEIKEDLKSNLTKIQASTENIRASLQAVNSLAKDGELRADVKEIVRGVKDTLEKVDRVLSEGNIKGDVVQTLARVRQAATNVDIAAKQLQGVMDKRAPLLHMMFGRPGRLPEIEPSNNKTQAPEPGK